MSKPFNFSEDNDDKSSQEPEKTRDYSQGLFGNYYNQQNSDEEYGETSDDNTGTYHELKDEKSKNDNGQNTNDGFQDMFIEDNSRYLNNNMNSHYHNQYSQHGYVGYNPQDFSTYSQHPYPYKVPYPQKPLNSKGLPSNWPDFLIKDSSQKLYGLGSLVAGFVTSGIIGIGMAIYYLFILDDSIQKDTLSKVLNWISLIIPVIFYILIFLGFFLFLLLGATLPNL